MHSDRVPSAVPSRRECVIVPIESTQCDLSTFFFSSQTSWMVEGQRIAEDWLFLGYRDRPGPAVLQEFAVGNVGVSDSPVGKEGTIPTHSCGFHQQGGNGTMNVGLTHYRNSFIVHQSVGCARHNAQFRLQGVPALDGNSLNPIVGSQLGS